jgi:hypothetical protein
MQTEENKFEVEVEGGCAASRTFKVRPDWPPGEVSVEIALVAVKFGRSNESGAEWEHELGEIKIKIAGAVKGKGATDSIGFPGQFEGAFEVSGEFAMQPHWGVIIADLAKSWGADLTCDVVAGLAIPIGMALAGIATIVMAFGALWEEWNLDRIRSVTPTLVDNGVRGHMAGLRGQATGDPNAQVQDADSAFSAGAASGTTSRSKIIATKCGGDASKFEDWLQSHAGEVEAEARKEIDKKIHRDLWRERADHYAHSLLSYLPGSESGTLRDQYNAWTFIIGGQSPKALGGDWLDLWLAHRVADSVFPERSAGDW